MIAALAPRPRPCRPWRSLLIVLLLLASPSIARESPFADLVGDGESGHFEQLDQELTAKSGERVAYRIDYTRWRPEQPNGTVVVYNHGLQSHRGWFSTTARFLQSEGYTVYAFDRIGSGTSSNGISLRKGEPVDARGHVRDWRLFLDTLELMIDRAREENPGSRIVLWGNSYGAKVVTAYLFERTARLSEQNVAAAVLTAPGNYRNKKTMPLPFRRTKLLFAGDLVHFPVPMVAVDDRGRSDNGAAWFVAPGEWFDRIANDDLSLREVTRRFYLQTRKLDRAGDRRPKSADFPIPAFVAMVRGDRLMDNDAMEEFVRRRADEGTLFKYYAGGPENKHFLLLTADGDQARADIAGFLRGEPESIEGAVRP